MTARSPALLPPWKCAECGQTVRSDDGYLCVDQNAALREHWAAQARKASRDSWERIDLSNLPDVIHWQVLHRACDPNVDRSDYWIAVERCATAWQLLDWTAHLMEKNWVHQTDWSALIRRITITLGVDA